MGEGTGLRAHFSAPRAPGERQPAPRTVSSAVMELTAHIAFIPPGSAVPASTIPSSIPLLVPLTAGPTAGLEVPNPAVAGRGGAARDPGGYPPPGVVPRPPSGTVILSWYYRGTSVIPD